MSKRNISYIKPEDPAFLRDLKKQAGYDDRNHKFDELQNSEKDFVDDEESELPQVVVLKHGDLTAEEADLEKKRIEKEQSEVKADLTQKVIFNKPSAKEGNKRKVDTKTKSNSKKSKPLLSFDDEDEIEDD